MNAVVKLVILVVTLLLVNNMAFAVVCDQEVCYDVTKTYEDGSTSDMTWFVCLNEDGTGNIDGNTLALFGGGPNTPSFDMVPFWYPFWFQGVVSGGVNGIQPDVSGDVKADNGNGIGNMSGYIWTTGDSQYINGVFQDYGNRYIVKGQKVDCEFD